MCRLSSYSTNFEADTSDIRSAKSSRRIIRVIIRDMGQCSSTPCGDPARARSRTIERNTLAQQRAEGDVLNILLLGAGESGKSTVFKQARVLYRNDYTDLERKEFIVSIHYNVLNGMCKLVKMVTPDMALGMPNDTRASMRLLETARKGARMTPAIAMHISRLWASEVIRDVFYHVGLVHSYNNLDYFFDKVGAIAKSRYVPSNQDILNCRIRTTGISEMEFYLNRNRFKIIDIGGQRSERRKWIHVFNDVHALLYVVGASAFNEVLEEDQNVNRMLEAIELFKNLCKMKQFSKSAIVLFLNKKDLFCKKIKAGVSMKGTFPDFPAHFEKDVSRCSDFVMNKFAPPGQQDNIFMHWTCANDSKQMNVVFKSIQITIQDHSLLLSGLS